MACRLGRKGSRSAANHSVPASLFPVACGRIGTSAHRRICEEEERERRRQRQRLCASYCELRHKNTQTNHSATRGGSCATRLAGASFLRWRLKSGRDRAGPFFKNRSWFNSRSLSSRLLRELYTAAVGADFRQGVTCRIRPCRHANGLKSALRTGRLLCRRKPPPPPQQQQPQEVHLRTAKAKAVEPAIPVEEARR